MSPTTLVHGRRLLTGTTVAALTAGVLAFTPTTAHAATESPTLEWKISDQFVAHFTANPAFAPFTTLVASDGATLDATTKVTTFSDGVGTFDSGNGAAEVAYQGSITGSFITGTTAPGTTQYTLTIADPTVIVADGEGRIEADVAWTVPGDAANPSGSTEDVVLTRFDAEADDWSITDSLASLTATPDFVGVLPAGSAEAVDLGIPSDLPLNGGSFDPAFLAALNPGLRAHFYLSGSASGDPRKPVAPFTATAPRPSLTVNSVTGATVEVSGSGFTCSTNADDAGVYIGVAPAGGLPDVSSTAGMSNFAGAAAKFCSGPTPAIASPAGTFDATVNLDLNALDPTKEYAVYTWRAHTHSTTSQDTETPLTIDFDALKKAPAVSADSVTYGTDANVTVNVAPAESGSVALSVDGGEPTSAEVNEDGEATFTLSGLTAGTHELSATLEGDAWFIEGAGTATLTVAKAQAAPLSTTGLTAKYGKGGTVKVKAPVAGKVTVAGLGSKDAAAGATVAFTVAKNTATGTRNLKVTLVPTDTSVAAPPATTVTLKVTKSAAKKANLKVSKKPTTRKKGKARVVVKGVSGAAAPTGKVRIKLIKGKKSKVVTVNLNKKGAAVVKLPKLAKGTWKIKAAYLGNGNYTKRSWVNAGKVKVTKK